MFNFCVGAGRANEGLRADWQRQLTLRAPRVRLQYIRMHGLFDDDMGVYRDSNGKPEYNWQYIDELYDFLQSIGMKPFVELSFMPGALASGSKTIFWYRGNVTPPKDMNKWAISSALLSSTNRSATAMPKCAPGISRSGTSQT
jgi:xylan 1,4-beta-xylosidase